MYVISIKSNKLFIFGIGFVYQIHFQVNFLAFGICFRMETLLHMILNFQANPQN